MDPVEIVSARPELQQMRQRAKLLLMAGPIVGVAAVAAFVVHEPVVGWAVAAFAAALVVQGVRVLLALGGRIEAIKKAESGIAPGAPPKPKAWFFAGMLGKMSLVCMAVAGIAAAFSVAQFAGAFHTMEGAWLGPFFATLWLIVGFVLGSVGQSVATTKLRERLLRESGVQGTARIVRFSETGTKVNDAPRVKCDLEITVPGRRIYTTTVTSVVPVTKVPLLTAGKPVRVFADPNDPNDVLIDW